MRKKDKSKRVSNEIRKWGKAYCKSVKHGCFSGNNKRFRDHVAEVVGVK